MWSVFVTQTVVSPTSGANHELDPRFRGDDRMSMIRAAALRGAPEGAHLRVTDHRPPIRSAISTMVLR